MFKTHKNNEVHLLSLALHSLVHQLLCVILSHIFATVMHSHCAASVFALTAASV